MKLTAEQVASAIAANRQLPDPPGGYDMVGIASDLNAILEDTAAINIPVSPTSLERLAELTGLLEEMTTGGSTELTIEQASDIHDWLEWCKP